LIERGAQDPKHYQTGPPDNQPAPCILHGTRVKKVYEVFGSPDNFQTETFDADHSFYGVKGLPFLAQHL
jgi:hypothetical protein